MTNIIIDPQIFEKFPYFKRGIIKISNVNNNENNNKIKNLLDQIIQERQGEQWVGKPEVVAWDNVHQQFGSDPNKFYPSIKSLLLRIQNNAHLPFINSVVALFNYISLKYLIPLGGDDIDSIFGNPTLKFASGNEIFTPLGKTENEPPIAGEVIYVDDMSNTVMCRRWNWRNSEVTKIQTSSKHIIVNLDAIDSTGEEVIIKAREELVDLLAKECQAEIEIDLLTKEHNTSLLPKSFSINRSCVSKETIEKVDDFLARRINEAIPNKDELRKRLLSGKRLRLYQGFDPSSPNLHIGHLVGLLALKTFQDLGHEVIFLIGDFTATIGDPSGKDKTRVPLTLEQTRINAQSYQDQVKTILKFDGDNPALLKFNSEWLKEVKLEEALQLAMGFTVQQMIEREMFQIRLKEGKPISLHEFLYPVLVTKDAIVMDVDIEMGGFDQLFNMSVGRHLIKSISGKDKVAVTTPLLADASGVKIGKTAGNAINIANPPEQLFGQIMSLPDSAIMPCFKLATLVPTSSLTDIEREIQTNPMETKKQLAWEMVKMLQGEEKANFAKNHFETTVQGGEVPEEIPTFEISKLSQTELDMVSILVETGLAPSKSHARRLIEQGAVKIDEQIINDVNHKIAIRSNQVIKAGKRIYIKLI